MRNDVFKFFKDIHTVCDMYCGSMEITKRLWSNISNLVIAFDKKEIDVPFPDNVIYKQSDSRNPNAISLTRYVNVIDCDAYGIVIPHIKAILDESQVDKIIFFTDGTPTKNMSLTSVINFEHEVLSLNPDDYKIELSDKATAYYGWVYKKCFIKK